MATDYMTELPPRSTGIDVDVHRLAAATRPDLLEEILDVYAAAFGQPPWNEGPGHVAAFHARLRDNVTARRDGLLAVARGDDARLAGFATAWTTASPFPSGRSYTAIADALPPAVLETRLAGCREIDELAVHPSAQGRGIGGRLLDSVAPHGTACWLVTSARATAAVGFYRARGWDELTAGARVVVFATPASP